eukprot:7376239-Prymnesium_polylepis.1
MTCGTRDEEARPRLAAEPAAEKGRHAKAECQPDGKPEAMLQAQGGIVEKVVQVGLLHLRRRIKLGSLEEDPAHVGVPETLAAVVRVGALVRVPMVHSVLPRPADHLSLQRSGAEGEQRPLDGRRGLPRFMGPQPVISSFDAETDCKVGGDGE